MCKGRLEAEYWELPGELRGTRGGMACLPWGSLKILRMLASPSGLPLEVGLTAEQPPPLREAPSARPLPHLWERAPLLFILFYFFGGSRYSVCFYCVSKEAFNNIPLDSHHEMMCHRVGAPLLPLSLEQWSSAGLGTCGAPTQSQRCCVFQALQSRLQYHQV